MLGFNGGKHFKTGNYHDLQNKKMIKIKCTILTTNLAAVVCVCVCVCVRKI